MSDSLKFAFRFDPGAVKKITIDQVDMTSLVHTLKNRAAQLENIDPEVLQLIFCGKVLSDQTTLAAAGLRPGVTIHVLKKKPAVAKVVPLTDAEILHINAGLRLICKHPHHRIALAKMGLTENLEKFMEAVPALRDDYVARAYVKSIDGLIRLGDTFILKKLAAHYPSLGPTAILIVTAANLELKNIPPTSGPSDHFPLHDNLFSIEALSEEDDMDDASQESDPPQRDNANPYQELIPPANAAPNAPLPITLQMFNQALQAVFQEGAGQPNQQQAAANPVAPNDADRDSRQLRQKLEQMREVGLNDRAVNILALRACDMDVEAAINLVLSGAMQD